MVSLDAAGIAEIGPGVALEALPELVFRDQLGNPHGQLRQIHGLAGVVRRRLFAGRTEQLAESPALVIPPALDEHAAVTGWSPLQILPKLPSLLPGLLDFQRPEGARELFRVGQRSGSNRLRDDPAFHGRRPKRR